MSRDGVTPEDIVKLIKNINHNCGVGNFMLAHHSKTGFRHRAVRFFDIRYDAYKLAPTITLYMMTGEIKTVELNRRADLFGLEHWLAQLVPVPEGFDPMETIRQYPADVAERLGFKPRARVEDAG